MNPSKKDKDKGEAKDPLAAIKPATDKPAEREIPKELVSLFEGEGKAHEKLIEEYGNVGLYNVGEDLLYYKVNLPFLTPADKRVIDSVQHIAARTIDVKQELRVEERKEKLKDEIKKLIIKNPSLDIARNKLDLYSDIISREMGGYGLIDYLLDDEDLEEVMVVPPKRTVYVFHRRYGMCSTNIILS